jgi:hypothetical protein
VKSRFVVNRDLFAGFDVSESEKEDVAIHDFHVAVWRAGMIDVMSAISAATAVKAPTIVDGADAQNAPLASASGFRVGDPLAGVLGDLPATSEMRRCETPFAVDERFADR